MNSVLVSNEALNELKAFESEIPQKHYPPSPRLWRGSCRFHSQFKNREFSATANKRMLPFLVVLACSMLNLCAVPNDSFSPNPSVPTQHFFSKWAVSADAMAWLASEEVSSIWADVIAEDDDAINIKVPSFKFKWDYGFRIGAGSHLAHDQWDTVFYWTRFHTDARHSISSILQLVPAQEFFAGFLSGDNPTSLSATWRLSFNKRSENLGSLLPSWIAL